MSTHSAPAGALVSLRDAITSPPDGTGVLVIVHDFARFFRLDPAAGDVAHQLKHRLAALKDAGIAGVVCNVASERYLDDDAAWHWLAVCIAACAALGLRVWVYDEDGYPSGTAGGRVPRKHPELEAQGLARLCDRAAAGKVCLPPAPAQIGVVAAWADVDGARIDLTAALQPDGGLRWTAPAPAAIERYIVRRAFEHTHATLNVCAVRRYINVLDPAAVRAFLAATHEQYVARLGPLLAHVDAFFTDEPSFMTTYHTALPARFDNQVPIEDAPDPAMPRLPMLPWWAQAPAAFRQRYGYDLVPRLGCLFADGVEPPARTARIRQDFHELLARQYANAYFGQLQAFLDNYGISLTGHALHEEPLWHHVGSEGSLMLALAPMRIPGCDILTGSPTMMLDSKRFLTPKFASSTAHLRRREEVVSECSDWEEQNRGGCATLAQRYGSLALQALLGVTTFASYYNWKRFDPADAARLHRAAARICAAVRRGVHVAPAALLYPIRAVWAGFVPVDHWVGDPQRPAWLAAIEDTTADTARALLAAQRDFDFIDEDALEAATLHRDALYCGREAYSLIILPPACILSERAAERLGVFVRNGGTIVAFEPAPQVRYPPRLDGRDEPLGARWGADRPYYVFAPGDSRWLETVLRRVPPALRFDPPTPALFVRHARDAEADIYLIVNTAAEEYRGRIELPDGPPGADCELLNPWTGQTEPTTPVTVEGYGARILLRARPTAPELAAEAATLQAEQAAREAAAADVAKATESATAPQHAPTSD